MKILVPHHTRSEMAPLEPFIKICNETRDVDCVSIKFDPKESLSNIENTIHDCNPDIIISAFDRPEMVKVAYVAYHNKYSQAQICAGDIAGGAWDDRDRFVISNYADLLFCAGTPQYKRVSRAVGWRSEAGDAPRVHLSGATHYDDMNLVEPYYDKGEYDLVLYNPPSLATREQVIEELDEITYKLGKRKASTYWVAPNGDENSDLVWKYMRAWSQPLADMPRKEFLGWLKHAKRFIGNSSALAYEAPYFRTLTEQIGVRNRYRETPDSLLPGASSIILNAIYLFLEGRQETKRGEEER